MNKDELIQELRSALRAALGWIDAVPDETVNSLPSMPGFDRDWADNLLTSTPDTKDQ